jgi:protein phosphatase
MSKFIVRIAGLTDQGLVRAKNEDAIWVDPNTDLLIVADGMGGHPSGEKASTIAVRSIPKHLASGADDPTRDPRFSHATNLLAAAVLSANRAIFDEGEKSPADRGMGTTCTAAWIRDGHLSLAHVGDTRCYLVRKREISQLTQDHSLAMEEIRQGRLTAEEARHVPQNYLTRALGTERTVDVDMDECDLFAGDTLILCSDGLDKGVSADEIRGAALGESEPETLARRLIELAIEAGGTDNVTVAVAMISSPGLLESVWKRLGPR